MGQNHKAVFVLTHLSISNFTRRSGHLRSSMMKFIQGEKQRYNCIELNSATTTNSYGIIFSLYLNITKHASCSKVIFEAQPVFRACSCVEYVLFWMDRTESRRDCSLTVPTDEILLNGSLACFKNAKQIVCFVKCFENMIPGNVYSKNRIDDGNRK